MGTNLIFCGPSTAGKTTLMVGLTETKEPLNFTIDRTLTTRPRRNNEDDRENIFLDTAEFEEQRSGLLFSFQNFPDYEYGINDPGYIEANEVRMRILLPRFAADFRSKVAQPTIVCSISPFNTNPEEIFSERGTNIDDFQSRLSRFHTDKEEADNYADLHFQNFEGIELATSSLALTIINYINESAS